MTFEKVLINYDGINEFRNDYELEGGCVELTTATVIALDDFCKDMDWHIKPLLDIPRFQSEMLGKHIDNLRRCIDEHFDLEEGILFRRYSDVTRETGWVSWENPSEEERSLVIDIVPKFRWSLEFDLDLRPFIHAFDDYLVQIERTLELTVGCTENVTVGEYLD